MSSVELARGRRGPVSHLFSRSRRAVNQVAAQDGRLEAHETLPESPYRPSDKDLPPKSSQIGTPWPLIGDSNCSDTCTLDEVESLDFAMIHL